MKAKNLNKIFWKTPDGIATFQNQKAYGILNNDGLALSKNGISPSTWGTLKTAKEIALYADGFVDYSWVKVYHSINEALKDSPENGKSEIENKVFSMRKRR